MGQAGAPSGAAPSQNLAAIGGAHTLTEPMLLGTLTLLGLIGTDHFGTPPVRFSAEFLPPATTAAGQLRSSKKNPLHRIMPHDANGIIAYFKMACQHYFLVSSPLFLHVLDENPISCGL